MAASAAALTGTALTATVTSVILWAAHDPATVPPHSPRPACGAPASLPMPSTPQAGTALGRGAGIVAARHGEYRRPKGRGHAPGGSDVSRLSGGKRLGVATLGVS